MGFKNKIEERDRIIDLATKRLARDYGIELDDVLPPEIEGAEFLRSLRLYFAQVFNSGWNFGAENEMAHASDSENDDPDTGFPTEGEALNL